VIGIVHNNKDAEAIQKIGHGKIHSIVHRGSSDMYGIGLKAFQQYLDMKSGSLASLDSNYFPELTLKLRSYELENLYVSGAILVLTNKNYQLYLNDSFSFAVSLAHEATESILTLKTLLPDFKGDSFRLVIVYPDFKVNRLLYKFIPHNINATEIIEILFSNAIKSMAREIRSRFPRTNISVSVVFCPADEGIAVRSTEDLSWYAQVSQS